jgi:hypothetical protein
MGQDGFLPFQCDQKEAFAPSCAENLLGVEAACQISQLVYNLADDRGLSALRMAGQKKCFPHSGLCPLCDSLNGV